MISIKTIPLVKFILLKSLTIEVL